MGPNKGLDPGRACVYTFTHATEDRPAKGRAAPRYAPAKGVRILFDNASWSSRRQASRSGSMQKANAASLTCGGFLRLALPGRTARGGSMVPKRTCREKRFAPSHAARFGVWWGMDERCFSVTGPPFKSRMADGAPGPAGKEKTCRSARPPRVIRKKRTGNGASFIPHGRLSGRWTSPSAGMKTRCDGRLSTLLSRRLPKGFYPDSPYCYKR